MNPITVAKPILAFRNGIPHSVMDEIVTEYPLTIFLNHEEFATLVCTPEFLEELVIGFLASEGILSSFEDVKSVLIDERQGFAYVETHRTRPLNTKFYSKRYITSCCGKSRQSFYFYNDARTTKTITDHSVYLTIQNCLGLMEQLQNAATTFQQTGGVHNAALCDAQAMLVARMDIGRHNALDKIYGYCLKHKLSLKSKVIAFSGRISSEILLKAAKIGCEVILSKSAPTELAIQMADELGITAVGFIRSQSLNVYSHPDRIRTESSP